MDGIRTRTSIDGAREIANTLRQQAETIRILVMDVGCDKNAAIKAVAAGDLAQLAAG